MNRKFIPIFIGFFILLSTSISNSINKKDKALQVNAEVSETLTLDANTGWSTNGYKDPDITVNTSANTPISIKGTNVMVQSNAIQFKKGINNCLYSTSVPSNSYISSIMITTSDSSYNLGISIDGKTWTTEKLSNTQTKIYTSSSKYQFFKIGSPDSTTTTKVTSIVATYTQNIAYEKLTVKKSEHAKTSYYVGDSFDPSGYIIKASTEDGTTISNALEAGVDFDWYPKTFDVEGNNIDVTFSGKEGTSFANLECSTQVKVVDDPIQSIYVNKSSFEGKKFVLNGNWNTDGIVVEVTRKSGTIEVISNDNTNLQFVFDPETPNSLSLETVTFYADYNGIKSGFCDLSGFNVCDSGTKDFPFTVLEAINKANTAGATATTDEYFVKGKVEKITSSYNSQYGNMSFTIEDDSTTDVFTFYRCIADKDVKFTTTSAAKIVVGQEVIGCGKLMTYNSTPEFSANCYVYDLKATSIKASEPTITELKAGDVISSLSDIGVTVTATIESSGEQRDVTLEASVVQTTLAEGENEITIKYTQKNKYTGNTTNNSELITVVTININSSTSQQSAEEYAGFFIEYIGCDPTGSIEPTGWEDVKMLWSSYSDDAKEIIRRYTSSTDTKDVIGYCVFTYDYILNKYQSRNPTKYNDFMGRSPSTASSSSMVIANINDDATLIMAIITITLTSVTFIASYFFIKKRKVTN